MVLKFNQVIVKAVKVLGRAGMFSVLALMIMMTVDVILRYVFNKPLLWSYDASEYLMVCFTYFALAYTELRGDHVNIDMLFSRFRKKTQTILNLINRFIMLALSILIATQAWQRTIDSLQVGRRSTGPVGIPQMPVDAVMFIGWVSLCLLLVVKIHGYGSQLFDLKSESGPLVDGYRVE